MVLSGGFERSLRAPKMRKKFAQRNRFQGPQQRRILHCGFETLVHHYLTVHFHKLPLLIIPTLILLARGLEKLSSHSVY